MQDSPRFTAVSSASLLLFLSLALSGCGSGNSAVGTPPVTVPPVTPPGTPGVALAGIVMAGPNAIAGASIQLFAAGTTGNGVAPTSLLASPVLSGPAGDFSIASGYMCPSPGSLLYLVASGGAPVLAVPVPENPAITLLATLGRCDAVSRGSNFMVNEVTTAGAAWTMAQFLSPSGALGASASNTLGLANAMSTNASLVNASRGTAPGAGFPPNGTSPAPRIHALANLLNTCTTPLLSSSPPRDRCPTLFAAVSLSGAAAPTNTLAAALAVTRNPGHNVPALFALSQEVSAFTTTLSTPPADWTLHIAFTGGGMNAPASLGVDSTGAVWIANYFGVASKFSQLGLPLFDQGISGYGLENSFGLAVDAADNVWIANQESSSSINRGIGSLTVLNAAGSPISGNSGFSAGGLNYPVALAIDTNASVWIVNYGNSALTVLSGSGQPLSGAGGYTGLPLSFPVAVLLDDGHNAWVANQSGSTITSVASDGTRSTTFACCNGASGLAIDQHQNIWVSNYYGSSISEVSSAVGVISSGYTGGGIDHPQGIAVDGSGNLWISNYRNSSISELAGADSSRPGLPLSPDTGFGSDADLLEAYALAIDRSGNLWVTSFGNNTLTEFIGLAAPVKTPLLGPPQAPYAAPSR